MNETHLPNIRTKLSGFLAEPRGRVSGEALSTAQRLEDGGDGGPNAIKRRTERRVPATKFESCGSNFAVLLAMCWTSYQSPIIKRNRCQGGEAFTSEAYRRRVYGVSPLLNIHRFRRRGGVNWGKEGFPKRTAACHTPCVRHPPVNSPRFRPDTTVSLGLSRALMSSTSSTWGQIIGPTP